MNAFVGEWTVSAIASVLSGFPFSPQFGYNPTGNPAAFLPPATGTYGNVSRDSLVGPGSSELDFSAAKSARITEGLSIQFRAEFFNILNYTNFLTPNPVVYSSATSGISPTAGVITATSTTARQIQFGAKLRF